MKNEGTFTVFIFDELSFFTISIEINAIVTSFKIVETFQQPDYNMTSINNGIYENRTLISFVSNIKR